MILIEKIWRVNDPYFYGDPYFKKAVKKEEWNDPDRKVPNGGSIAKDHDPYKKKMSVPQTKSV